LLPGTVFECNAGVIHLLKMRSKNRKRAPRVKRRGKIKEVGPLTTSLPNVGRADTLQTQLWILLYGEMVLNKTVSDEVASDIGAQFFRLISHHAPHTHTANNGALSRLLVRQQSIELRHKVKNVEQIIRTSRHTASNFYSLHCKQFSKIIHSILFSVCLWTRSFRIVQLVDLFVAVSFCNSPLQGGAWQKLASKFCLRMLISMPHESSHPPQTVIICHALLHCARSSARYPLLQLYVIFLPRALVNNEVHIPAPRAVHGSLQRAVHVTRYTIA
ncbi:hypothetical protein T4A_2562, partial [Trichinella pseudospiralis]